MMGSYSIKSIANILIWAILIGAILMRLDRIMGNDLLFYDEGMYLGYNRSFLELVAANPPHSISEFFIILGVMFKTALSTAKALWFFILELRVFIVGPKGLWVARMISTLAGLATIWLTFHFARRYFRSFPVALGSAGLIAILPSHVFYSRLGMQESLSTLLFLSGLYLYCFSKRGVSFQSLASAVVLAMVYFTNYRMIILPVFLILAQVWMDKQAQKSIDIWKLLSSIGLFAVIILGVGSLYGGINNYVNFGWMLNQAKEAHAHQHWINFLSFPYYVFTLEDVIFGIFLFLNFYFIWQKQWQKLLPFAFVMFQMILFSFAAEKGARYLCVVLPFEAMAVSYAAWTLYKQNHVPRKALIAFTGIMLVGLYFQSLNLTKTHTDYQKAVDFVLARDPQAKIMSTQPVIESLFVSNPSNVIACPKDPAAFEELVKGGYRYLIIDPQVYISWTYDQERFTQGLMEPLEMIRQRSTPIAVLPHIEGALLKRFVLDHNQDLFNSLGFLRSPKGKGNIYIYDLHT